VIEETITAIVLIYLGGFVVTLLSVNDVTALGRRTFLWPFYWIYLAADFLAQLWRGRR
jgi:hypothetical protein